MHRYVYRYLLRLQFLYFGHESECFRMRQPHTVITVYTDIKLPRRHFFVLVPCKPTYLHTAHKTRGT